MEQIRELNSRWKKEHLKYGIVREYSAEEVVSLRPTLLEEHTLAKQGALRLRGLLDTEEFISALGCKTGSEAVQAVRAGLPAIYLSGWQVAADANEALQTYPDQSLYPSNSVPRLIRRLNNALIRQDQVDKLDGKSNTYWYAPIVADAEAGFGGKLHAFELMQSMIDAGASGVHYEDQLASEKKCGHLGGKVLIPTSQFIDTLKGARLAADVLNIPTVLIARTDSLGATLLQSDIDPRDQGFIADKARTSEGFYRIRNGLQYAIARSLNFAPYADLLWFETSKPDKKEAEIFADAIHYQYPGKLLMYNCSPSFNWKLHLKDEDIASFQKDLGSMGYKFQFVTLAGWHSDNISFFELSRDYKRHGMSAYADLQEREFKAEQDGYTATKHQREAGTGYFDKIADVISAGKSSTKALAGSTEVAQFH